MPPPIRCIDEENCRRRSCRFVHPGEPDWPYAIESNLAKKKRAQAAAAGHGSRDTGYESRPKASRESTGRGSITSATSGRGDSGGGKASPERTRATPHHKDGAAQALGVAGVLHIAGDGGQLRPTTVVGGLRLLTQALGTRRLVGGGSLRTVYGATQNPLLAATRRLVRPSPRPSQTSRPHAIRIRRHPKTRIGKGKGKENATERGTELQIEIILADVLPPPANRRASYPPVMNQIAPPSQHSILRSANKNLDTASASAASTTTSQMPISISLPHAVNSSSTPAIPLGFGVPTAPRGAPSVPSAQSSAPPPPPSDTSQTTVPIANSASKSPPQSSGPTKTHALPVRPAGTNDIQPPPSTSTSATPMVLPHGQKSSATPTTSEVPEIAMNQDPPLSVAPGPTPTALSVDRPYEWIESLESLIKQNRVLQNCKLQYARAETQEKMLARLPPGTSKRKVGDSAPSLSDMRRRIETTEAELQVLLGQFASRMEVFYRPTEMIKHVDGGKQDEETLSMARRLSDQVSKLESEMQLLNIGAAKGAEMKKLDETIQTSSQAIKKEREERTKAVEDVKKDFKVLGEDLNRTKVECEHLREELVASGSNFDQVRRDAQAIRDDQVAVKEEVKATKLEAENTKTDVQTVKAKMNEVDQEVTNIKTELERLRTKLATPPPTPPRPSVPSPATTSGKRARNETSGHSPNAMDVDDVLPPAKRARTADPLRPSPFVDSSTPFGSPKPARFDGISRRELSQRIDMLEGLIEGLQGDVRQVETDLQDQIQDITDRMGSSDENNVAVTNAEPPIETRSESAPPGPSTARTMADAPRDGRPRHLREPRSPRRGPHTVAHRRGAFFGRSLGVESLDGAFRHAPRPPIVNGKKTPEPQGDWAVMFKSMQEEQAKMREEMVRERVQQESRMRTMVGRLEQVEEELDKSVKRRDEVERECEVLKSQQAEQRQLLVHLQSVMDNLPKPSNGLLSSEELLQDAMRNGASPVQQELAALRSVTISSHRSSSRTRAPPVAPSEGASTFSYGSDTNSRATTTRTPTRSTKDTTADRSMANPSSREDRDRDRDRDRGHRSDRERRERTERSHHHHHRTISSTTLLLVLSLILAILAVMLSLPSSSRPTPATPGPPPAAPGSSASGAPGPPPPQAHGTEPGYGVPEPTGFWSHLSPKRGKDIVQRESLIAMREAELARREAELLAGPPAAIMPPIVSCPPAPIQTVIDAYTFTVTHTLEPILPPPMPMETATVVKEVEVVREQLEPPPWYRPMNPRFDEVLDREAKVAERERDIAMREDIVGRRENDAGRREGWIMEQLMQLQNEPNIPVMDDEYVYEVPGIRRKLKEVEVVEVPAEPVTSHIYETVTELETIHHISTATVHETTTSVVHAVETSLVITTKTAVQMSTVVQTSVVVSTFIPPVKTVTVPMPAGTRAAPPAPERPKGSPAGPRGPGRTNVVEIATEEEVLIPVEIEETQQIIPPPQATLPPPPPPPPPRDTVTVMHDREYNRQNEPEREREPPQAQAPPPPRHRHLVAPQVEALVANPATSVPSQRVPSARTPTKKKPKDGLAGVVHGS
ncbi:leucine-rich repeat protein [Rhizoctonia solani]|uniref:Leucine-rich repeat protein n=1 Tax=Rhizoctonia solani TaxID=456999 RepID=A0A8H8NPM2_9AGAM|nr:leucine-rich repeat protein [Rhizoctonia solani]QRW16161.1 leucine-rich repeat protein [Rhizoctonia solani]